MMESCKEEARKQIKLLVEKYQRIKASGKIKEYNEERTKKEFIELKHKQTDEEVNLEKEIQKLDDEIDQEVYKLYGLSEKEIKIIEKSLK